MTPIGSVSSTMGASIGLPRTDATGPTSPRLRWAYTLLGLLLVALVGGASWIKPWPAPEVLAQESLMKSGLDALHTRNDPGSAAVQFRKVLALNPSHYGATFQLAAALDRLGKPEEAR